MQVCNNNKRSTGLRSSLRMSLSKRNRKVEWEVCHSIVFVVLLNRSPEILCDGRGAGCTYVVEHAGARFSRGER